METFTVVMIFGIGDPESAVKITLKEVPGFNALTAAGDAVSRACASGKGFTYQDLIEVTVTLSVPGVKRNLLAQHRG